MTTYSGTKHGWKQKKVELLRCLHYGALCSKQSVEVVWTQVKGGWREESQTAYLKTKRQALSIVEMIDIII